MKQSLLLNEDMLIQRGIDILIQNLGPTEAKRFLSLPSDKRTDSVKRHRIWQSKINREKFFDEVFGIQEDKTD